MPAFPKHPDDRRFYTTMAVVAAVGIVAGFANPCGPKVISGAAQVRAIVHLHAVLFACWLVLFVAPRRGSSSAARKRFNASGSSVQHPLPVKRASTPTWRYIAAGVAPGLAGRPVSSGIQPATCVLQGVLSLLKRTSRWIRKTLGSPRPRRP